MTNPYIVEIIDGVALVSLSAPPVNALGFALRRGLLAVLDEMEGNLLVREIALLGAGRAFSAGADISEFGKAPQPPALPDVLDRIEASAKPVIASIHGVALGGGLELAMAAHLRVAAPGTSLGLPEVTLGLIPGAGGTQRLPRLVGAAEAISMITSGKPVAAEHAAKIGLIDMLLGDDPRANALEAVRRLREGSLSPRVSSALTFAPAEAELQTARARLSARRPQLAAPLAALDAIAAAAMPYPEGAKAERELFLQLMQGPDRQGLIHAFKAERASKAFPEAGAEAREIKSVGVIGGGTMGVGIATSILQAGLPVTLIETTIERAEAARRAVSANIEGAAKRGKTTAEEAQSQLSALRSDSDLAALSDCDLVIEAVFEDMGLKKEIFAKLDRHCPEGAILATNTSYLDVNEIASVTSRPGSVLGLHFFSPAHLMRLLEIVVADRTEPGVVATALALAQRMKKVPVRSGVCDGFIGNRILAHYRKVTDYLLLDGADFTQIDRALRDVGFALGPFEVADLAGLDIGWATRKRKAPTRPAAERYVEIADRICEGGDFGRKTGRGFYDYSDPKAPRPSDRALAIVAEERAKAGIVPRSFSDEEIVARYMTAMISEAARVLEEGIAQRSSDIDAVLLFGYGFPRHLGGPMNYADRLGAARLVADIEAWSAEDAQYWQVPALLRRLAETGGRFADHVQGKPA